MGEWQNLILALAGAVLGSSVLTAFVTLYFARPKTAAEADKLTAEAHKAEADTSRAEAETMQLIYGQLRSALEQWKTTQGEWSACVKEKAEALAENEQLKRTVEVLRIENVAKDKTITELHGRLNG